MIVTFVSGLKLIVSRVSVKISIKYLRAVNRAKIPQAEEWHIKLVQKWSDTPVLSSRRTLASFQA